MNLKSIRKYRRLLTKTSGLIRNNPVVALGLALPFVIVPTLNLKSGLLMSAFIFAATVTPATLAPVLCKKVPVRYHAACASAMAMAGVVIARILLKQYAVLIDGLGLYIPLAALNSIMLELSVYNPRKTVLKGFGAAIVMCLGFTLVACGFGAMREILGSRTIWGIPFSVYPIKMSGVMLPFFGFILLGFFNALCRSLDRIVLRSMLSRGTQPRQEEGERA